MNVSEHGSGGTPPAEQLVKVSVGDRVTRKITYCGINIAEKEIKDVEKPGRVIYVHPKGRFYTVQFDCGVRQCYPGRLCEADCEEKAGGPRAEKKRESKKREKAEGGNAENNDRSRRAGGTGDRRKGASGDGAGKVRGHKGGVGGGAAAGAGGNKVCNTGSAATLGERIKSRRQELGLTQEALAERLGVDVRQVWKYESGRQTPRAKMLASLSEALRMELQ